MHTNSTTGSGQNGKPQTVHQQQKPQTSSQVSRSKQQQLSSFQTYATTEKQQQQQQIKPQYSQRGLNDSTTKFMISKILNGDLENITTNSTNSAKVLNNPTSSTTVTAMAKTVAAAAATQNNVNNTNSTIIGTKSSLNSEKPNHKVSGIHFYFFSFSKVSFHFSSF